MKILALVLGLAAFPALAGEVVVVDAKATNTGSTWRFDVTLAHADTGWEHYADGWGIYAEDGTELGFRVLVHPHVDEQPFTRSLGGVVIPLDTAAVIVRGNDSVHGWSEDFALKLE